MGCGFSTFFEGERGLGGGVVAEKIVSIRVNKL